MLEAGGATEARVADLLKEVRAAEAEQAETIRQDMDAIDAALTPLQQAKYRLLEGEVERKIRGAHERPAPAGPARPARRRRTEQEPLNPWRVYGLRPGGRVVGSANGASRR